MTEKQTFLSNKQQAINLYEIEKLNNAGSNNTYKHISSNIMQLLIKIHYNNIVILPKCTQ